MSSLRRVVLIGPESTGKTRLTERLAAHYDVPWSAEFAREYVEEHSHILSYVDVAAIGRGQRVGEDAARQRAVDAGAAFVLHDTDLVSTLVYSRHYYGACPAEIEREILERRADLYLLHRTDVDWVADGVQREQPARREELFGLFREILESLDATTTDIHGSWADRERRAHEAIRSLLDERGLGGSTPLRSLS